MSRLAVLHDVLATRMGRGIPDCTCVDCTRLTRAGRLLARLDTLLALLDEMSQDADMPAWYSACDLRTVLRMLDVDDEAAPDAGEEGG